MDDKKPITGVELIAQERQRQIEVEGWTPEHDDEHKENELTRAAICYADTAKELCSSTQWANGKGEEFAARFPKDEAEKIRTHLASIKADPLGYVFGRTEGNHLVTHKDWPWSEEWWKPTENPLQNLVKAGALIAAEIDRIQRKEQP